MPTYTAIYNDSVLEVSNINPPPRSNVNGWALNGLPTGKRIISAEVRYRLEDHSGPPAFNSSMWEVNDEFGGLSNISVPVGSAQNTYASWFWTQDGLDWIAENAGNFSASPGNKTIVSMVPDYPPQYIGRMFSDRLVITYEDCVQGEPPTPCHVWNAAMCRWDEPPPCPPGTTRNPITCECEIPDPPGPCHTWDEVEGEWVPPDMECPEGFEWDWFVCACVPIDRDNGDDPPPGPPLPPPGPPPGGPDPPGDGGGGGGGGMVSNVCLSPAFTEERLPTDISRGSVGGPTFDTTIVRKGSGFENRIIRWDRPIYMYTISHNDLDQEAARALMAFFLARRGRGYGFRFKDWNDYRITTPEPTVLMTGETTEFQLVKRYTSDGGTTTIREIFKPVENTVRIFNAANVEVTTGWSVDVTTGIVTFAAAPAYTPKATFEFDVPCRFDTDKMELRLPDVNIRNWESISIIELRC